MELQNYNIFVRTKRIFVFKGIVCSKMKMYFASCYFTSVYDYVLWNTKDILENSFVSIQWKSIRPQHSSKYLYCSEKERKSKKVGKLLNVNFGVNYPFNRK